MNSKTLFDFNQESDLRAWRVVNDTVMGGRSSSNFELSAEGHGKFSGTVSLKNNGGFSSVRFRMNEVDAEGYTKLILRLKGDGKSYQIRVKDDSRRYYSYTTNINTSGDWEEIEITLADMYPQYRGRVLNRPNFSHPYIDELAILIGNKKPEDFEILIDKIALK